MGTPIGQQIKHTVISHDASRRIFLSKSTGIGMSTVLAGMLSEKTIVAAPKKTMDIFDVVHTRRSVRNFRPDPIPDEHISQIIDAARFAPTSGNQQPWKFLVVKDRKKILELGDACLTKRFGRSISQIPSDELTDDQRNGIDYYNRFTSAPVFIIVLTDLESRYPGYNHHDGPLAAGYLLLAARALGYGSVYITDSFPEDVTRDVFNIPSSYQRVCITPIGIPVEWPEMPPKRDLEEFIQYDQFG